MLLQTPSRIFKTDFRIWTEAENAVSTQLFRNEEKIGRLKKVSEVVLNENSDFRTVVEEDCTIIIFPLYGEIILTDYYETIKAGETLTLNRQAGEILAIGNQIFYDKSDVLILEFQSQNLGKPQKKQLNLENINHLTQISETLESPNFTGLFSGRAEGFYALQNKECSIFAMVVNGAFEFQNRLLENRDAILLWGINEIDFEALSENAIIFFLEI